MLVPPMPPPPPPPRCRLCWLYCSKAAAEASAWDIAPASNALRRRLLPSSSSSSSSSSSPRGWLPLAEPAFLSALRFRMLLPPPIIIVARLLRGGAPLRTDASMPPGPEADPSPKAKLPNMLLLRATLLVLPAKAPLVLWDRPPPPATPPPRRLALRWAPASGRPRRPLLVLVFAPPLMPCCVAEAAPPGKPAPSLGLETSN